ncbi:hypothetical protein SRHO_G00010520 [Serrasalmus rhombeus]
MNLFEESEEDSSLKHLCPIQQERSDSPIPSCISMKSGRSIHPPPEFKDRDSSSGHSAIQQERSDSPIFSCASMKSDRSIHPPPEFKDSDPSSGHSSSQQEKSDFPEPSCVSMNSDRSIHPPPEFKDGDHSGYRSVLACAEKEIQEDFKLTLKNKFQCLSNIITTKVNPIRLSEIYTEIYITEGDCGEINNEHESRVHTCDVTEPSSVDVLLINLIKGNLLPSALIWITSRPAAADQIPSEFVDRVTEVRGFSDQQKKEYFRKRINDQSLVNRIISHLERSRSLFIMCHIPVFCWISATVLERMLGEAESGEIPKTLTQMYTHFLIIQTKIIREKYPKNQKTNEEILLKLGQLAFQQLMKGHLIFYEEDLRECGIDVEEASVYSGVCTQIFREESGLLQSKVYCFVHLSIQEHLAALYVHLTFMNQKINVLKQSLFSKLNTLMNKEITLADVHKSAVDQALQSKSGHLDLFLRFLVGFSLESNQTLLQVTQTGSSSHSKEETVQYIKKKIKENSSAEKTMNLFHCLNELNDHGLVEEVQQYLQSGDLQTRNLSSSQWSAVVFVLLTSSQNIDVFDLHKYTKSYSGLEDVFLKLLPVVAASRRVHLTNSNLKRKSWTALASVISSECSNVRELHLSRNELGDSGVKLLSAGLENLHCKLETLWLVDCNITDVGCAALASVLKSNPSHLKILDLSRNKIGNAGIQLLSAGLQNPYCKVETLKLECCNITDKGCAALASVLASNPSHLRELNLYGNKLGDSGVKLLSVELENPHCNLETLWLRYCNFTDEGCAALASALKTNPSHLRELHLSGNKLGDSGVKLLSDVLKNPLCKLETLWLQFCNITDEGCATLASALKSNPSHLKELDLSGNVGLKTGYQLLFAIKHDNHYRLQDLRLIFDPTD